MGWGHCRDVCPREVRSEVRRGGKRAYRNPELAHARDGATGGYCKFVTTSCHPGLRLFYHYRLRRRDVVIIP